MKDENVLQSKLIGHSDITLIDRANFYQRKFPNFPPLRYYSGMIDGIWIMGNNYTTSGYYGAYPFGYIERITSLFPDCKNILHLFAGSLPKGDYTRFDLDKDKADVSGDAEKLTEYFKENEFDIVYADPPYSVEDAEHYGKPLVNRNRVMKEALKVVKENGFIVWLDQVLPIYNKLKCDLVGVIGIVKSTNHRFRVVSIFQKKSTSSLEVFMR